MTIGQQYLALLGVQQIDGAAGSIGQFGDRQADLFQDFLRVQAGGDQGTDLVQGFKLVGPPLGLFEEQGILDRNTDLAGHNGQQVGQSLVGMVQLLESLMDREV